MLFSDLPIRQPEQVQLDFTSEADLLAMQRTAEELEHPWLGYTPAPPMEEFHKSEANLRYVIAGSQVGKTFGCARELWMNAGCCHPYRITPPPGGLWLIACAAYEGTPYEGLCKALYDTRPDHLIDWSATSWTGRYWRNNTIQLTNGSTIKIITSRGSSTAAASVKAAGIWIDEPPKRDKMAELLARTTQTGGPIWLSFTPIDSEQDLTWLREYIEGYPDRGIPAEAPGWVRFSMPLAVASCPWMTQKRVDEVYALTPAYLANQRLYGQWDTPPVNSFFRLLPELHDSFRNPFRVETYAGGWKYLAVVDHGELVGHQFCTFLRARKRKRTEDDPFTIQVEAVDECSNVTRSSFAMDAKDMRAAMERIGLWTGRPDLAYPAAYLLVGDVNSAGKGFDGISANDALSQELGTHHIFRTPDKGAGSVDTGTTELRIALDRTPPPFRIQMDRCPQLWRAVRMHSGVKDNWQHAIDTLRYGVVPYLTERAQYINELPAIPTPGTVHLPGVKRK